MLSGGPLVIPSSWRWNTQWSREECGTLARHPVTSFQGWRGGDAESKKVSTEARIVLKHYPLFGHVRTFLLTGSNPRRVRRAADNWGKWWWGIWLCPYHSSWLTSFLEQALDLVGKGSEAGEGQEPYLWVEMVGGVEWVAITAMLIYHSYIYVYIYPPS